MGKFDGKHIRGLVGNLISRKTKDGLVLQMAPIRVKQSKGTKKAQKVFGQGSVLAGAIRRGLRFIIHDRNDSGMVNRFNTPVRDVLKQCFDKQTEQYSFQEDSFERLTGFEFNIKSLLINSLLVKPELHFNGVVLKVSIPEIVVPKELKFPGSTNQCELVVSVTMIALHERRYKDLDPEIMEIDSNQELSPAQEFEFEVSEGCLCVAGIGLRYFKVHNNMKAMFNSDDFNPANVCGAVVTPGMFKLPPPEVNGNTIKNSGWAVVDKLKLTAAE